jgi:hypothetical protein
METPGHEHHRWPRVARPNPDSDIDVTAVTITVKDGGTVPLVRVNGFEPGTDYLSPSEARQMARALIAAVDAMPDDGS